MEGVVALSTGAIEVNLFKAASIIEFIFEAGILIACVLAWRAAGFLRLIEVATVGGLAFVCFGAYIAIIWNKK